MTATVALALFGCASDQGGPTGDLGRELSGSAPADSAGSTRDASKSGRASVNDGGTESYDDLVARVMRMQQSELDAKDTRAPQGAELVNVVRIVDEHAWPAAQISCLAEAGFTAAPLAGGGYTIPGDIPAEQVDALDLASWNCEWMYPIDPRRNDPLSQDKARALYRHLVDVTAPCIEGLGYAVPEPPSEDVWLSQYVAGEQRWDPVAALAAAGLDQDAFGEALEACPPQPEGLYPPVPAPAQE